MCIFLISIIVLIAMLGDARDGINPVRTTFEKYYFAVLKFDKNHPCEATVQTTADGYNRLCTVNSF